MEKKILVIDDDRTVCASLKLLLKRSGYSVRTIHHPTEAMDMTAEFRPHVVLLDMNFTIDTSGKHGLKMLDRLMAQYPQVSVILITGWATLQLAVEGMKRGAKDFLAKPWDNKQLLSSISTIFQLYHTKMTSDDPGSEETVIVGDSLALSRVMDIVDRVAPTDASVLVTGESGTGKELIAEAIHQRSKRADGPFVRVNLGGISTTLFESELFGHVKGAFTGAHSDREGRFTLAQGGTLFLDEIGELSLESQVKLLRVLQEKTYEVLGSSRSRRLDARIVCATNRSLPEMVAEGTFREDLYYRINLIEMRLPSLSERRDDIPLLVKHFLKKVQSLYDIEVPYVPDETYQWLSQQSYSGNIRQLKNLVERTALLNYHEKELTYKSFQSIMSVEPSATARIKLPQVGSVTLEEMERQMIIKTLQYHNQSISKTSRSLGLTRSSLYRRIEKYGIEVES